MSDNNREAHASSHHRAMQQLSCKLDGILEFVPAKSKVIYLDIPVYLNVGDLLINRGTENFFKRSKISVIARFSIFDLCRIEIATRTCRLRAHAVRAIRELDPAAILVFQGGGNFGDLYPDLQLLREAVIEEFTERQIVVLPQSVHFESSEIEARSLTKVFDHPNIHFFLRDKPSWEILEAFSAGRSTLMPDMAHALWGTFDSQASCQIMKGTLHMSRRDSEKRARQGATPQSIDWDDVISPWETLGWRFVRKALHTRIIGFQPFVMSAWYRLRDRLIDKSVGIFCAHDRIETDRLHGLILATLVSRPVTYHDNSYGKLGRYAREWLGELPHVVPSSVIPSSRVIG